MKLEPANIVCPACGNGNYMRHIIGRNVGYLNMKCINCNSYFNFDELYNRRIGEVLKPKPVTNADKIRGMTDEELASFIDKIDMNYGCPKGRFFKEAVCMDMSCQECWEDWLKQEVKQ